MFIMEGCFIGGERYSTVFRNEAELNCYIGIQFSTSIWHFPDTIKGMIPETMLPQYLKDLIQRHGIRYIEIRAADWVEDPELPDLEEESARIKSEVMQLLEAEQGEVKLHSLATLKRQQLKEGPFRDLLTVEFTRIPGTNMPNVICIASRRCEKIPESVAKLTKIYCMTLAGQLNSYLSGD